jgi:methylmalonyl-CoA mutase
MNSDPAFETWERMALKALKGAGLETLNTSTLDNVSFKPLYERDEHGTYIQRVLEGAHVCARCDNPDVTQALDQINDDITNGVTTLNVIEEGAVGAYGFGIKTPSALIEGVLDHSEVRTFCVVYDSANFAYSYALDLFKDVKQGRIPACVHVGYDPLGSMMHLNDTHVDWALRAAHVVDRWKSLRANSPDDRFKDTFWTVDGRIIHNKGGNATLELAYMLACGVSYLRMMADQGINVIQSSHWLIFKMSVDADQAVSIAKLRAFRLLWASVLTSCGLDDPAPANIYAETSWRMMAAQDVHTNLIRTTLAIMSALVGGADHICALPFSQPLGLPDAHARRLARNTTLILRDEAHLGVVNDPMAGSGLYEALTSHLAQSAWLEFQQIEEEGGLFRSMQSGAFIARVDEASQKWQNGRAHGDEKRIGVDLFQSDQQVDVPVIIKYAAS